jgi:two-component system chemotaxis response regulator CheY
MRVLVVDDAAVMRALLGAILRSKGFEVAGEAAGGADALAQYRALRPEVVTLDVTLSDMDGVSAVRALLEHDPAARIIACGFSSQRALVDAACTAGAFGYMTKPFAPLQVAEALERARNP